jgi:Tryptophan-rich Synechocystis species C-terminal domain
MKSRFITDPDNPLYSLLDSSWDQIYANFSTPGVDSSGNPSASTPAAIPPTALTDEAIQAQNAQSGSSTFTLAAATSGGITINLLFDSAAMAAPASFRAGIEQAASILTGAISDKITVNIRIDYSGTGGGAAAGPQNGLYESYSSVRADLVNNATSGDTIFNALPGGSTFQGQTDVAVWNAQLKLFGLLGANDTTTDDGAATFATDISPSLLVGVALHELTHAMGRVPYGPVPGQPNAEGPQPDIFDFFRFSSPGTRLIEGGGTASPAYFSVDGGNTKLADYGQTSDASDFLNSGVQGYNDPFNEFYSGGTSQSLTLADIQQLDALGFHTATPVITVIQTDGSTSLTEVGNNFYLYNSGTGPELKYRGAAVTAGEFGSWTPIGAIQVTGGYDVAWKIPGADQYTVWNTDGSGNYVSNLVDVVSGSNTALEALETTFHQDLNGDGIIGIPPAASPASVQLASAHTGPTAFDGSTLTLENPSTFHGQIIGFSGDGTLAGSDQIDLRGLNFNSIHSAFDSSTGTLSVSGGSTTTSPQFLGHYSQDNFHFADDGNGGTMVYAAPTSHQPAATSNQIAGASPAVASIGVHDTFVFAPNFGQVTIANFAPATDTIQFSKSVFANVNALLAATHDDPSGNAVITDAAHDTITIGHVTTAQLLAHQNDFHIV